jgi:hypothetical protein
MGEAYSEKELARLQKEVDAMNHLGEDDGTVGWLGPSNIGIYRRFLLTIAERDKQIEELEQRIKDLEKMPSPDEVLPLDEIQESEGK